MKKSIVIAVDFDGTMVEHKFPEVGGKIGAGPVLRLFAKNGVKIILDTMRSDESPKRKVGDNEIVIEEVPRKYCQEAIDWCNNENIPLYGVNTNPTQSSWTSSPKCHADYCIDDRNVGCPLTFMGFVDWLEILSWATSVGIVNPDEHELEAVTASIIAEKAETMRENVKNKNKKND